jgi:hypothetical protein
VVVEEGFVSTQGFAVVEERSVVAEEDFVSEQGFVVVEER